MSAQAAPTALRVPPQSHAARYPGITLAARELGVTRGHLWQVLTGNRASPPLIVRWRAWLVSHPDFSAMQTEHL